MNHVYRVIWNAINRVWQVVPEHTRARGKTRSVNVLAAVTTALSASFSFAADLPTGGVVTAGSGTISQSGNTMTVTQTTPRMAADWQSFSIGQGHHVNFVQPSASAVALNRVIGSDVSMIQGSLTANGHVFLINPNGVLFTPTAQVNVGGIVASTQNINTANFMQGSYIFEGASNGLIVNQGNITTANGGTIALIAAKVINDGTLTANTGNVLLGAGSKVTLDLGGPVKLQVENDVLETLISNGGAIKADGGTVLLTSQAAANLASSVINNTGVIEAQTLATGETGEVVLFAHGGDMQLGGKINAAGGFVETSGKYFSVAQGAEVRAAHWLIDPVNVTIDAAAATALQTQLASGSATVTTDSAGADEGNIDVNADITWAADYTLEFFAHNNININANVSHTGTSAGGLIFKYGQGSTDGGASAYTVAAGKSVTADSIQWKKGSQADGIRYAVVDGDVFIGGQYIELGLRGQNGSLGKFGTDVKPSLFYGRQQRKSGIGMVGAANGFENSLANGDGGSTDLRIDYFKPGAPFENTSIGYGGNTEASSGAGSGTTSVRLLPLGADNVLKAEITTVAGDLTTVQIISLGKGDKFFTTDVTQTNTSASALNGVTFVKNFDPDNTVDTGGDFETIQKIDQAVYAGDSATILSGTSKVDPADPYYSKSGSKQATIFYYTTDSRARAGFGGSFWGTDITSMQTAAASQNKGDSVVADDAMGLIFNLGDLGAGQSTTFNMRTVLAMGTVESVTQELGISSPAAAPSTVTTISQPQQAAIQTVQSQVAQQQQQPGTTQSTTPQPFSFSTAAQSGSSSFAGQAIGSLDVVQLQLPTNVGQSTGSTQGSNAAQGGVSGQGAGDANGGGTGGGTTGDGDIWGAIGSQPSQPGLLNVYVAGSGVQMPNGLTNDNDE